MRQIVISTAALTVGLAGCGGSTTHPAKHSPASPVATTTPAPKPPSYAAEEAAAYRTCLKGKHPGQCEYQWSLPNHGGFKHQTATEKAAGQAELERQIKEANDKGAASAQAHANREASARARERERQEARRETCRRIESQTGEGDINTICGREKFEREKASGELTCKGSSSKPDGESCVDSQAKKEREAKRDRQLAHINERIARGENAEREYREYEAGEGWQRY